MFRTGSNAGLTSETRVLVVSLVSRTATAASKLVQWEEQRRRIRAQSFAKVSSNFNRLLVNSFT